MGYLLLALSSAVLFGVWKFGLSLYRGRISVYAVMLVSTSAAGAVYVVLGAWQHSLTFDAADVPAGLIGGVLNFIGTLMILKAFERGKIGVVVGVAASYVLVPLGYSIYLEEQITVQAAIGVTVLLVGLAVFYAPSMRGRDSSGASASRAPILLALGTAVFWGLAIVVLDVGTRTSVTGTLITSLIPVMAIAPIAVLASSEHSLKRIPLRAVAVLAGAGAALALGDIAFFNAADEGDVGVVAVLGSLSPVVTALLAFWIIKERLRRSDRVAFVIVLIGAVLVVS